MINVITVEREYGSGAGTIAKKLADRLGWSLWDRQITCEIARRLKCDEKAVEEREERLDSTFYRLAKIFMRGSYEESYTGGGMEMLDAEGLSHAFERIIKDIASKGNSIIVGRAAPWFLRDRPDTFHVFIYASYQEKLRRLLALGNTKADAERLLETVDDERAAFIKRYYKKTWPQRDLYHMMINSKVGDQAVMDLILTEIDMLDRTKRESRPA
ncbi:MAG TPA: cytidylate kinase-like family protein [Bryobacteraceae bacterium]|nr:cytidylate kinase-like family protein [Bryobacteraceae bacterium]